MKLYKYRGLQEYNFESLEKNTISASHRIMLNDPAEFFIDRRELDAFMQNAPYILLKDMIKPYKDQEFNHFYHGITREERLIIKRYEKQGRGEQYIIDQLGFNKEKLALGLSLINKALEALGNIGLFCLSKNYNNMLMWSHYANEHKGFIIEYDISILKMAYSNCIHFDIEYLETPPKISITDILYDPEGPNGDEKTFNLAQKLFSKKATDWRYEQECRIIYLDSGIKEFFAPISSIYFGLNMSEENKNRILNILKNKDIKFYQMHIKPHSYELEAIQIN